MRLLFAFLLASSACAQPEVGAPSTPKPSAAGDDGAGARRADSVVVLRPDSLAAPTRAAAGIATDTLRLALGDTPVAVLVHTAPAPGGGRGALAGAGLRLDALSLHDDENTSVEAALEVIAERGGRVVELRHTGARLLAFRAGGASYTVDPNRIFTETGRRRTLAQHSRDTPAARAAVAAFADRLLALYTGTRPDPVVTLHNNTEGNYSAASYRADLARDASAVALTGDPDDFFFVTGEALYGALVPAGFAVVQQNDATATDDGSLSVWAARAGAAYVNVEAQHGHRAEQTRMLHALADALGTR